MIELTTTQALLAGGEIFVGSGLILVILLMLFSFYIFSR